MQTQSHSINPFYATRWLPAVALPPAEPYKPIYAKLPRIPVNASPVPGLTSLYHSAEAGDYGNRGYPGNCGGNLIKDLLRYFEVANCFDPLSGSGTCRDVCRELNIPCVSGDIHQGFDACDPTHYFGDTARFAKSTFDIAWLHPPYWRMKLYADDSRDLSRAPTLEAFLERYKLLIANCKHVLKPGGIMAILVGDYSDRQTGFTPLTYFTKKIAFECGLRQHSTDIIRFSHGASSGNKVYKSRFIPGLHDVCMLFEKPTNQEGA